MSGKIQPYVGLTKEEEKEIIEHQQLVDKMKAERLPPGETGQERTGSLGRRDERQEPAPTCEEIKVGVLYEQH